MGSEWQHLQRIQSLEGRVLKLELALSIMEVKIEEAANVRGVPEGRMAVGVTGPSETPPSEIRFPEEPDDDEWLTRLAGLETAPEETPNPIQREDDDDA